MFTWLIDGNLCFNGTKPSLGKIECGVPQGSVLGLLFFTVHINEIQNAVRVDKLRLFADETALFMSHTFNRVLYEIKPKFKHLINGVNRHNKINAEKQLFWYFPYD